MKWTWEIGRLAGIDAYIHATFLLVIYIVGISYWNQHGPVVAVVFGIGFVLALFWKKLTTAGAIAGGTAGLLSAIGGIVLGPAFWVGVPGHAEPIFPYQYPTIMSLRLAITVAVSISLLRLKSN